MPCADPTELAEVPLFRSLTDVELTELAARFEAKDVGPGTRLVGEGTTGSSFFVLRQGQASVATAGKEIALLGPGDFFGEIALLGQGRRTATVTTISPARVLVLFGDDFRHLQAAFPAVAAEVEAAMRERLEER